MKLVNKEDFAQLSVGTVYVYLENNSGVHFKASETSEISSPVMRYKRDEVVSLIGRLQQALREAYPEEKEWK